MWFKNLVVYRLPADWSYTAAQLEERLARRALTACGAFDMQTRGWVPPGESTALVHSVNRQLLIALGTEEKLLPASIVRQQALERAKVLAKEQGFPVGRRQMRELKDRITTELRARALTRRKIMHAWIDPVAGWFVINAASLPRAEELTENLRDTLGSFAVTMLEIERSPQVAMAAWLMLGDAPTRFSIDQDLELQSADKTKASVRYARHPLHGKDIQAHITSGKYATRLGLTWNDRIAFVLTEKLQIKRLQFLEIAAEKNSAEEIDPAEQFDIDFALLAGELAQLLQDIHAALGGEQAKRAA